MVFDFLQIQTCGINHFTVCINIFILPDKDARYEVFEGNEYKNHKVAKKKCEDDGGRLARITDPLIQDKVADKVSHSSADKCWVEGERNQVQAMSEDGWYWLHSSKYCL